MKDNHLNYCRGEGTRDRQGAEQDCRRIFSAIHEVVGGELPENLCKELEELREKCPFCVNAFLDTLEKTVEACHQLPRRALSDEDRTALRRKVQEGLEAIRRDIDNGCPLPDH